MKVVVCIKEVPDPDAVHALAIGGRLAIDEAEKTVERQGVPLLMNGFDEQAIEAALRLRDAGVECSITGIALNCRNPQALFLRAFSLGVDEGYALEDPAFAGVDTTATAAILALGQPRYPKAADMLAARRRRPTTLSAADLGLEAGQPGAREAGAYRVDMYIPQVQGQAELIPAEDLREAARTLLGRLQADRVL